MRSALITALLLLGASVGGYAEEPSRFHVSGAAGLAYNSGLQPFGTEGIHLGAGLAYSVKPYLTVGADLGYSQFDSDRFYWGLVTLTVAALPSARVSPYLVLGFGPVRYVNSGRNGDAAFGLAGALGAGLNVRLNSRVSLFVEGRFALAAVPILNDGLHGELPVTIGVRFGL